MEYVLIIRVFKGVSISLHVLPDEWTTLYGPAGNGFEYNGFILHFSFTQ